MSKNVALITGITGQDGSYLAEFLLEKGYEVHGIIRRSSVSTTERIDHLIAEDAITLHDGDLSDSSSIIRVVNEMWMHLVCFVFWKQYICLAWIRLAVFIRHRHLNYMEK